MQTINLDSATLTRVGYVDVAIPPEAAGLTANDFAQIPWRTPLWSEGDQLRAGAAIWFADITGARIAFDPVQAADYVLRADRATEAAQQRAIAQLLDSAGFPRESVDLLVMTHIEGVGMVAWRNDDGSWSPFFPNARVLVSDAMLAAFANASGGADGSLERQAWQALIDLGLVDTYADGDQIVEGVSVQVTGAHCPGHTVVHFDDAKGARVATMLGHLAISPLHLATGECAPQHVDPRAAWTLLHAAADDERLLIGPLWPTPGYGRWVGGEFVAGLAR